MKKSLIRLMSCILVLGMVLSLSVGSAALADSGETGSSTVDSSGTGTTEDPKITSTTTTSTDGKTGETTIDIEFQKEWAGENAEGKSVEGMETGEVIETKDKNGSTVNAEGTASGSETTTSGSSDIYEDNVQTDNGAGKTGEGGPDIETDVPDVTVSLTPGNGDEQSELTGAWFDESTLDIPEWVRPTGESGPEWITEGSSSEESGVVTNVTVQVDPDTNTRTYTRTITSPDGKVTRETVSYTTDENGNIIGYDAMTTESEPATTEQTEPPENATVHADGGWTTYGYELPEKPTVATDPKCDEEGNVIDGEIVAEILDGNGQTAGYMVVRIENGKPVSYSDPVLGRYVATTTREEALENGLRKLTTTKTTLVNFSSSGTGGAVSDGYRTVNGSMGDVNGTVIVDYAKEFSTFLPALRNSNNAAVNSNKDLYNRQYTLSSYDSSGHYFQWLGEYGIESTIRVKSGNVTTWQPHQFVLEGAGNQKYYVYCADFNVSPEAGSPYNLQRLEDADYYKHNHGGAAEKQIRAIVLNGYWGTDAGSDTANPAPGSLEAFRKMLVDANILSETEAAKITDGMALTATQAAIWYYGNSDSSGSTQLDSKDIVGDYYNGSSFYDVDPDKKDIVNRIYRYLIKGLPGQEADAGNTLITKDDFASKVDLTVGEMNGDGKYNTDIVITMAVIPDNTTSDLIVYVSADGETVASYRLCGDVSNDAENGIGSAVLNSDGSYTLSGVMLPSGKSVTLNLKGTQNIENGVYLFSCSDVNNPSQTFVGTGSAKQEIDLNVNFEFSVEDPVVVVTSASSDSESEKLEWAASYYTFSNDGVGEGGRNTEVPSTGDNLYPIQLVLAVCALLSLALAGTASVLAKKEEY